MLGFLFQPVLTYLATPMVGYDAEGHAVVEKCTLMGSKRISNQSPLPTRTPEPSPNAPDDSEECPVLTLYKIAGTAQITHPPTVLTLTPGNAKLIVDVEVLHCRAAQFSAYATRAPPLYS